MAARSKTQICGSLLAGIAGSNPLGGTNMSFVIVMFCRAEISATSRSYVQRSPTDCGESECDLETSTQRALGLLGCGLENQKVVVLFLTGEKRVSSPKRQHCPRDASSLLFNGYWGLFLRG